MRSKLWIITIGALVMASCVSKKEFESLQATQTETEERAGSLERDLKDCRSEMGALNTLLDTRNQQLASKDDQIENLKEQINFIKGTNENLLARLEDMAVINKSGAESIQKSIKSISDIMSSMNAKDSLNLILVRNLKRSLADINDSDVTVEVRGSVVYISISDKLLYASGSSVITDRAKEVLGKVAAVINDHNDISVMVEGHTDTVPISRDCVKDNWDLSAQRSAAVVRVLQDEYEVDPTRLTVAGRSFYAPKATNETPQGRALNRRTEIVITPRMDQFFELLVPEEGKDNTTPAEGTEGQ